MRVLILFDLNEAPPNPQTLEAYRRDLRDENWESEASVLGALGRLGHEAALFGVHDDVSPLLAELASFKPRLVFNLCEGFRGNRGLEPQIAALLELQGVRTTGASSTALRLCKDKSLSKDLVRAAGVAVPRSVVIPRGTRIEGVSWTQFPAIVKPLGLESSQGISNGSLIQTPARLAARARFVHERLGQDALVEEYVEGRELYLSVLCDARAGEIAVFPARELFFGGAREGEPRLATYRAKWDDSYRSRWGIRNGAARGSHPMFHAGLTELGRRIAGVLRLDGYARLDLRLTPGGKIFFLEANPNPSLAPGDDFAKAAAAAGLGYDELITKIMANAASVADGTRGRRRRDRAPTSKGARADFRPRRP